MKKIGTVAGASVAAFAVGATLAGGVAIATAKDTTKNQPAHSQQGFGFGPGPGGMHGGPGGPGGMHGTPASAEETQKVTDAILAQFPGATVHFVTKEADGTFEAHFMTSDAVRKEARLDANYAITSTEDDKGPGPGGMHGTPASTEETQKVTDAVLAEVPGATVHFVVKLDDGTFRAHFMTADGIRKEAHVDANFTVTEIHKMRAPKGGPRGKDVQGKAYRKAKSAALNRVDGTVMGVHKDGRKYFAMVRKTNGNGVIVTMNSNFKVTATKKLVPPPTAPAA